jgi:hypothetical protein
MPKQLDGQRRTIDWINLFHINLIPGLSAGWPGVVCPN